MTELRDDEVGVRPLHSRPEVTRESERTTIKRMSRVTTPMVDLEGLTGGTARQLRFAAGANRSARASLSLPILAQPTSMRLGCTAAVGDDRERMAVRMNDEVIRRLFGTGLHLQATAQMTAGAARERLEIAIDSLDTAIVELRKVIFSDLVGAFSLPTTGGTDL